MPVQRPQHCRSIGAAARQTRAHGNALGDGDGNSAQIHMQRILEHLGGLPGQVVRVPGNPIQIPRHLPGLSGLQLQLHLVENGNGLHHRTNIMVAVVPFAQDVQGQIDFGICRFV